MCWQKGVGVLMDSLGCEFDKVWFVEFDRSFDHPSRLAPRGES